MNPRPLLVPAVLLATPVFSPADVVHLNDGRTVEGTLKRDVGGWVVTDAAGNKTHVSDSAIKSIQKTSNIPPEVLAEAKVASLRRTVEPLNDPKQALARFEAFVEQNKGTPAAAAAEKDLALWKERVEKNMVKVAGQWVTPDQRSEIVGKSVAAIDSARSLIKEGRYREAEAALNQLLAADKNNVSGLYLKGVVAARQEQLGAAKRQFEMVRDQMADHGPTLNNLAVIHWMQRQPTPALALYDQAMQASPRTQVILNNVAEVLAALPDDQREQTVAKRVAARFAEQDAALQKQLEGEGLYRWGATYVDKAKKEELEKAQEKVKERLELLARDYQRHNDRLQTIDRLIEANEDSMQRMQRQQRVADPATGTAFVRPLPREYYDLKDENKRLKIEREGLIPKLDEFKGKARTVQQELPIPPYAGRQQFIDVEGTPLGVAASAAGNSAADAKPEK